MSGHVRGGCRFPFRRADRCPWQPMNGAPSGSSSTLSMGFPIYAGERYDEGGWSAYFFGEEGGAGCARRKSCLSVAWDLSALLCPWITADVTCAAVSSVLARALLLASCRLSRPDWAPPSTSLMPCTARKAKANGTRQIRKKNIEIQTTDRLRQNSSDMAVWKSGLQVFGI